MNTATLRVRVIEAVKRGMKETIPYTPGDTWYETYDEYQNELADRIGVRVMEIIKEVK